MHPLLWRLCLCSVMFLLLFDGKLPVNIHLHFHVQANSKPKVAEGNHNGGSGRPNSGMAVGVPLPENQHRQLLVGFHHHFKSPYSLVKIATKRMLKADGQLLKRMLIQEPSLVSLPARGNCEQWSLLNKKDYYVTV